MLAIRLMRTGKTHDPHYRIVVQEKRSKLNGKAIDIIGHYHPAQANKELVVDQEKAKAWLAKGAQASDTVINLLVKVGAVDKSKKVTHFYTPKPKEEAPVAEEKAAEAEATEVAEEVAEEVVAEADAETAEEIAAEEAENAPEAKTAEA